MRVCSLLPSATEIAFALGLGDEIAGVTHECDYPPQARQKPVVVKSAIDPSGTSSRTIDYSVRDHLRSKTSLYTLDVPRLQEAQPDFILTQALCEVCALDYNEVVAVSQSLVSKPRIIALNPHVLDDIFSDIRLVGSAMGKSVEADALVCRLKQRVTEIEAMAKCARRPRVACIEWLDPIFSAGHWVPEMVELAGGQNGLAERGQPSQCLDWNAVAEFNPEVLVLMPCGFDVARTLSEASLLTQKRGWSELPAVRDGRVFAVNGFAYFSRPGPRLIDGLEILAGIIHPEIFSRKLGPEIAQRFG
ncbi:MAG: cobalamin-binding protein [Deltaproteobacteria bacterium]|nr:cobalamin-binding protein [Deltaproteobacteria bacterium]